MATRRSADLMRCDTRDCPEITFEITFEITSEITSEITFEITFEIAPRCSLPIARGSMAQPSNILINGTAL